MALNLDLSPGDVVLIGNSRLTVEEKTGRRTRVRIESNEDVRHQKTELRRPGEGPAPIPNPAAPPALRRPTLTLPKP